MHEKAKKLTQEQLAELVNVSSHYIYEIEQGRKTMSLDTLEKISSELHISLDYLFWRDSFRAQRIALILPLRNLIRKLTGSPILKSRLWLRF